MQASESPGGPGENDTLADFPKGTKLDLCAKNKTDSCLTEHEYAFGDSTKCSKNGDPKCEFEDLPPVTAFNYQTHTNMPFKDTKKEIENLELKTMPSNAYPKLSP